MTTEVELLITQNKTEIDILKTNLSDILDPIIHDDLFLLRYILSNKTAKESEEPIRFTIKWYQDNKLHLDLIKNGGDVPHKNRISQFQVAGDHKFTNDGLPIFYVRIGLCNTRGLLN